MSKTILCVLCSYSWGYSRCSLVPRPIPSFSVLFTMQDTCVHRNMRSTQWVYICSLLMHRLSVLINEWRSLHSMTGCPHRCSMHWLMLIIINLCICIYNQAHAMALYKGTDILHHGWCLWWRQSDFRKLTSHRLNLRKHDLLLGIPAMEGKWPCSYVNWELKQTVWKVDFSYAKV